MMREDFWFDYAKKRWMKFTPICWSIKTDLMSEKLRDAKLTKEIIDGI